jgi:hypothetical protein
MSKSMSNDTIENATPAPEAESPKNKRKATSKASAVKKSAATKRSKREADRSNKKAKVVALMKRAKGATLRSVVSRIASSWCSSPC